MAFRCCSNKNNTQRNIHNLPSFIGILIIFFSIALFAIVYIIYINMLPTPLRIIDENTNADRFIAENAQRYLHNLARIGTKVGGSIENDVVAVQQIVDHLQEINLQINPLIHDLKIDQTVSDGSFELKFSPYGMTNVYRNIVNVVAKLSPANSSETDTNCLLINSHFDTMPDTDGASDAIAMIASMLEILRVLSKSPIPYKHCIVFLFNGAEENYMLGSHAFITQHHWAPNIKAFINMDSAGAGGRAIMYQAGPNRPFLMDHYRKSIPHPLASAMAEELFQFNLIPSDSDFRIFRDFGNIPGMDFAFYQNGYVYHTKYDVDELISLGTLQHVGDNVLAITKSLANSDELYDGPNDDINDYDDDDGDDQHDDNNNNDNVIFFDYQGLFLIFYTNTMGIIINSAVSIFGVLLIIVSMKLMTKTSRVSFLNILFEFLITFLIQCLSICCGVGITILLAFSYDAVYRSMSWYSNPWILGFIYVAPFLFGLGIGPIIWINVLKRKPSITISHKVQLFLHAQCLIYIILIIGLTVFGIRSAFFILMAVVFYLGAVVINAMTLFQNRVNIWIGIHILLQIIPMMFYYNMLLLSLETFIPITGRDGPDTNPDIFIAIFCIGMSLFFGGFIIPLTSLCKSAKLVHCIYLIFTIIGIILIVTPLGFPFTEATAPQRYWIYHTQRIMHNENSTVRRHENGYFMQAMDRHTPYTILDVVPEMKTAISTEMDCETELYCGLPLLSSRKHGKSSVSFWIPSNAPILLEPTILTSIDNELLDTDNIEYYTKRLTFQLTGPHHMGIFLSPIENVQLINWSILDYIPDAGPKWQNRDTYFIFINYGFNSTSEFTFYFDFRIPMDIPMDSKIIDIAATSHYLFHQNLRTEEFQSFLNKFPAYTYQFAWMSSYESWVY